MGKAILLTASLPAISLLTNGFACQNKNGFQHSLIDCTFSTELKWRGSKISYEHSTSTAFMSWSWPGNSNKKPGQKIFLGSASDPNVSASTFICLLCSTSTSSLTCGNFCSLSQFCVSEALLSLLLEWWNTHFFPVRARTAIYKCCGLAVIWLPDRRIHKSRWAKKRFKV